MAAYDPKRRRARPVTSDDEPAPVEALLDGGEASSRHRVAAATYGSNAASSVINLGDPGEAQDQSAEPVTTTPPAPEPEWVRDYQAAEPADRDMRKAVLAGVIGLLLVVLILWFRQRRR